MYTTYINTNEKVYRIYQELDSVTIIKTSRQKWLDHVNNGISQRSKESVVQHSWGRKKERKTKKEVAG